MNCKKKTNKKRLVYTPLITTTKGLLILKLNITTEMNNQTPGT